MTTTTAANRTATPSGLDNTRRLVLKAVPYRHETQVDRELFEQFEPGAFAAAAAGDPARIKIYLGHYGDQHGQIIGRATQISDQAGGLHVIAHIAHTQAGDDVLQLCREGVLDQCSIEFKPDRQAMKVKRQSDGLHVRHQRAQLLGVALVPHGAYGDGATVIAVGVVSARDRALARLANLNH